jgi:hypothetical protein
MQLVAASGVGHCWLLSVGAAYLIDVIAGVRKGHQPDLTVALVNIWPAGTAVVVVGDPSLSDLRGAVLVQWVVQ